MGGRKRVGVRRLTLTALLIALSVVILLLASYVPSGRLGIVAVAGLLPAAAVVSAGLGAGFFCYAGTSILAFFLLPAKECVLLYALLFGHYPMLKSLIEHLKPLALQWVLKLLLFNGLLSVLYFGFRVLFLAAIPDVLAQTAVLYVAGNVAFVLYDLCFSRLIDWYQKRIGAFINR